MTYCERDCEPMSVFDASCPCHEAAVRLSGTETNEQSRSRVSGTRERQKANEGDEMSDYVSEDRLDEISRRFNATFDELDSRDVHWLIAEVRRMREEHSDHVAARYWRTIQTQRRMTERQAATIDRLKEIQFERDQTIFRVVHLAADATAQDPDTDAKRAEIALASAILAKVSKS